MGPQVRAGDMWHAPGRRVSERKQYIAKWWWGWDFKKQGTALGVWRRLRRWGLISLVNSPAWVPKCALVTFGMRRDGWYQSGSNILPNGGGDGISKSRGQPWGFGNTVEQKNQIIEQKNQIIEQKNQTILRLTEQGTPLSGELTAILDQFKELVAESKKRKQ